MTTRRKVADEDSCLSGHRPDISGSSMNNDKTMTKNPFSSDFELDAFTKTQQYLIITSVLFFFTLLYGYLQELVAIHLFARQYGVFLTLVQFTGYTAFAALRRYGPLSVAAGSTSASSLVSLASASASLGSSNSGGSSSNLGGALLASPASSSSLSQISLSSSSTSSTSQPIMGQHYRRHTVPLSYCVGLAVGQAAMQSLSNLAMRYLNYPAKVMFKSCRVIPTMLFGVLVFKKKYSKQEWLAMVLLVLGLVAFTQADIHSGPDMDPFGILLIVASLILDAGILNVQDHCFTVFGSDEDEVVFTSYAGGTLLLLALCLLSGELTDALTFMNDTLGGATGVAAVSLVCFSTCGYLGVMCVVALTKRFGALVAALTTTARKALTVVLSFVLFPKPLTFEHVFGATLFLMGITLKATSSRKSSSTSAAGGGGSSSSSPPIKASSGNGHSSSSSTGTKGGGGASHSGTQQLYQLPVGKQHAQQQVQLRASTCGGGTGRDNDESGDESPAGDLESGVSSGCSSSSSSLTHKSRSSPKVSGRRTGHRSSGGGNGSGEGSPEQPPNLF